MLQETNQVSEVCVDFQEDYVADFVEVADLLRLWSHDHARTRVY